MAHTDQYHANLQKGASLSNATHHTSAEQIVAHNFTLELNQFHCIKSVTHTDVQNNSVMAGHLVLRIMLN